MRVLVTGGAGYIGSVVTEELLRAGHSVVVYDNLWKGHRSAVATGAEFVNGDIGDRDRMRLTLVKHGIQGVVHMAAHSEVPPSISDPAHYFDNNVIAGLRLLEAMRETSVWRIVYSSTAAVYGATERTPIDEAAPTEPTNPYGFTKLAFEFALRSYAAYGLRHITLRYFNAAGASATNGELHEPETHLIPLLLESAETGTPVTIYGDNWPTKDGTCVRDYVHVLDLARAHVVALAALEPGAVSRTYNIGGGVGYTVREVIDAVERITGKQLTVDVAHRRAGDTATLVADIERSRIELGWMPELTLDDMISSAWAFRQRQRSGSRSTL